jgi:hypothetical protein
VLQRPLYGGAPTTGVASAAVAAGTGGAPRRGVFGDSVRSRTSTAQINEVLLKVLCHNIRCLVHAIHEFDVAPLFERVCPQRVMAAQDVLGW